MLSPKLLRISCLLACLTFWSFQPLHALAEEPPPAVPGEVLVGVRAENDTEDVAAELENVAGQVVGHQRDLHAFRLKLRPGLSLEAAIASLQQRPAVVYAEPNYILYADATPNDPYFATYQYGPQKVQADLAWNIWQPAAQVIIAIVDTGIDTNHPDLRDKVYRDASGVAIGYNVLAGTGNATDDNGHGTHCAGIAAAEINNSTGIAGWNAQASAFDPGYTLLMPVKVLDSTGSGTSANVANGITWAADHGAKIISLSLGGTSSSTLSNAVQYAWKKGCVLVAAAGNSSSSSPSYPAGYANVISVAATDRTDTLASYSNYGSWVKVAAPGGANTASDSIYSTLPTYPARGNFGTNYGYLSGTSMACPHVSGEAALILSQNPTLPNSQINSLITSKVDPYTPYQGRTLAAGAGRINVYKALQAAGTSTAPGVPLNLTATAGNGQVSLSWQSSLGAVSYNIYRATASGAEGQTPYRTGVTTASFTDTGVTNGTTYYYQVTAVNSAGAQSSPSNEASAIPAAIPAAPSNLTATAVSVKQINLAWINNTTNQDGVYIERSLDGINFSQIATVSGTTTSYANAGLARQTTYYYRVRSHNGAGYSSYSNTASATTPKR